MAGRFGWDEEPPPKPFPSLEGSLYRAPKPTAFDVVKRMPEHLRSNLSHERKVFVSVPAPSSGTKSATLITTGVDDMAQCFWRGSHSIPLAEGLVWDVTRQQGHGLVIGYSRNGKGVSIVNPALLTYSGSMLVIDPKGESAWVTAEARRALGQRVVILDPWGEVNRRFGSKVGVTEQVTKWNPLAHLRPGDPNFSDDVAAIAEAIVIPTGNDPHWSESARELLSGLIAAVVEELPEFGSLRDVRRLLTAGDKKLLTTFNRLFDSNPDSIAAAKLRRFVENDGNEIKSIRSTGETQTALLDAVSLLENLETDDPPFDLAELATGRCTVFVVLPAGKLNRHGRWLRLILTMAIEAISNQEMPDLPVVMMCDEFSSVGHLRVIEDAYGLIASFGIRLVAFVQDLNQLARDYPDSWETFISNSDVFAVLGARDNTTTEYISQRLGQKINYEASEQSLKTRKAGSEAYLVPEDPEDFKKWEAKKGARADWESKERERLFKADKNSPEALEEAQYQRDWQAYLAASRAWDATPSSRRRGKAGPSLPQRKIMMGTTNEVRQRYEDAAKARVARYADQAKHPEHDYPGKMKLVEYRIPTDYVVMQPKGDPEPLMRPQDIRGIPQTHLLVMMPAGNFLLPRLVYYTDPRLAPLSRPNPLYAEAQINAASPPPVQPANSPMPGFMPPASPWAIPRQSPAHVVTTPAAQNRRPLFESQLAHVPGPYQAPLSARLAEWIMKLAPGEKACLSPNKFLLFTVSWSLTCPWHDEIAIKNEEVEACRLELERLVSAGVLRRLITDFWERL